MADRTPKEYFDEHLKELIEKVTDFDPSTDEATIAIKNLKTFSECSIPETPEPEPTTKWGKTRRELGRVLDNETTRSLIKAGGAFAGVATVIYATIYKDHVVERQALNQANQRNS